MPEMKEGESQSEWMGRCVPYLKDNEGKTQSQAVGQCLGMWRSKHGVKKSAEKITRDAFLFMDGGYDDFAQCSSCSHKTAEHICTDIGIRIHPDWSCGLYVRGAPNDSKPEKRVTAEEAGLVKRQVRCENCRYFDDGCELYKALNKAMPEYFDLDPDVDAKDCCNANTAAARTAKLFKDATVQSGHVTTAIGNSRGSRDSKKKEEDMKAQVFNQVIADQSENDLTNQAADIDAGETLDDEYETEGDIIKHSWTLPVKIEKANDKQQIFGWAYVSEDGRQVVVDKQDDFIPIEELEKAAYSYMIDSRKGRGMHDGQDKMSCIESVVYTKDKAEKGVKHDSGLYGWWVGFQVHEADLWKRIKSGELSELSIGGASLSQEVESIETYLAHKDVFHK